MLTGYLNFLSRAIFAGRAFTHRIYAKFNGSKNKLKQYHHVNLDQEFRFDLEVWRIFLLHHRSKAVCCPMVNLDKFTTSEQLFFYSDASTNAKLTFGAVFNKKWLFGQWEPRFIKTCKPSIEYLELFALTVAILTRAEEKKIGNNRIVIFCDNMAVIQMVNQVTSSCHNCMYLIRLLVLNGLIHNTRVFAKFVWSCDNRLSDSLSHLQLKRFRQLGPLMTEFPSQVTPLIWLASKIWRK